MRASLISRAPETAQRIKLGLSQPGEQGAGDGADRCGVRGRRDDDPAPADEAFAVVQEGPAARVVRKHENRDPRSEGECDFPRIRPFGRDDEAWRRVKNRRLGEIAPVEALEQGVGGAGVGGENRPRPACGRVHDGCSGDRRQQRRRRQSPAAKRADGDAELVDPCAHERERKEPAGHRPVRLTAAAPKRRQCEENNRRQTETKQKQVAIVPPTAERARRCPRQVSRISRATEKRFRPGPS